MTGLTRHIICKQTIDVDFYGREEDAFTCQQAISRLWDTALPEKLEALLNTLVDGNTLLRIAHLHIELDNLTLDNLEDAFTAALLKAVREKVTAAADGAVTDATQTERIFISLDEAALETWLFFLEHGYLPVWAQAPRMEELETRVAQLLKGKDTAASLTEKIRALLRRPAVCKRIAWQCPDHFVWMVINAICPADAALLQTLEQDARILAVMRKTNHPVRLLKQQLKEQWLQYAAGPATTEHLVQQLKTVCRLLLAADPQLTPAKLEAQLPPRESWRQAIQQLAAAAPATQREPPQPDDAATGAAVKAAADEPHQPSETPVAGTVIYIDNAGLVLLSPFLSPFLQACGCVRDGEMTDPHRAACLLQYLVNGQETPAEFELALNKILCGIPVEEPLQPFGGLLQKEKEEAQELLQTIIAHWQVLKDTSIRGLRQSFLQREGKLQYSNNRWLLQVTQQPYDMLLEHLPWSIQYIKNSWMLQLLRVDWF